MRPSRFSLGRREILAAAALAPFGASAGARAACLNVSSRLPHIRGLLHYRVSHGPNQRAGLNNYFCRVIDCATGGIVPIYADEFGTPVIATSDVADMSKSDMSGNFSFHVHPGTYHLDIYGDDATTFIERVSNIMTRDVQRETGDPGWNILGIGLFTSASGVTVPTGTNMVRTTGYAIIGSGSADYIYDASLQLAWVVSNPGAGFVAADGRVFRLAEEVISPRAFGARGDYNPTNDTGTDDTAAFMRALNCPSSEHLAQLAG